MYRVKKRSLIISGLIVFLIGGLLSWGIQFALESNGDTRTISADDYDRYKSMDEKYGRLMEMEDYLKDNYYEQIGEDDIKVGLYKGLFSSPGDPYTGYMTSEEFAQMSDAAHGETTGIGIVMQDNKEGYIEIIEVVQDAPAETAGVKSGDILIAVDGKEYTGDQTQEASTAARGEAGTKVKITVIRDGETKDFNITRAQFISPSVSSKVMSGNIGYIRVSSFNDNTDKDFEEILKEMEAKKVKGLVIDVRNNDGGIVSKGVSIADMLLDKGEIAYTEDRKGKKEVYSTEDGKTSLPYAVLVNEYTASTAEIFAVGIKENKGGPLVGKTTYGKGVIQKMEQFNEGDGVKITIMQYFDISGNPINKVGVKPDYVVNDNSKKEDKQLKKAISLLESR